MSYRQYKKYVIRDGLIFLYEGVWENSPMSDTFRYWCGIRGANGWWWRDTIEIANTGKEPDDEYVHKVVTSHVSRWLGTVATKIGGLELEQMEGGK